MTLSDLLRHASPDVLHLNTAVLSLPARTPPGNPAATEEDEQIRLFQLVEALLPQYPDLRFLFHVPNGGLRSKASAGRLKAAGVKAGVPDLFLPAPRGKYHGLWIEMKVGANKPTPIQSYWLESLSQLGYKTAVCYGAHEAIAAIAAYLTENPQ